MQLFRKAFVGAILASFISSATAAQCTARADMDIGWVGSGTSGIAVMKDGKQIANSNKLSCEFSDINMIDAGLEHPVDLHVHCTDNKID
ncbi:hypothetical protein PHISCL_03608 [Aspergillus sclerotialis]|uniref:Uncharacterized protein n=1 Tax=Aspergillus sclerotialis TaxID=2070753 RepID=A0A3A2ZLQ3_9EURO|nr:hypothetical protein PHISCL_03608 [Aspergillus sclerotialis]